MKSAAVEVFRDDLGRSRRLFRGFLSEGSDPAGFYSDLAVDTRHLMERHTSFEGAVVADFGGGPGFYSEEFTKAGAVSMVLDLSEVELRLHGRAFTSSAAADVLAPPIADRSCDVVFSSNLLEHVPDLGAAADRMADLVKPGGVLVLSYTVWWGPWGGHETSPWHYLGGRRAARRYRARAGRDPKNLFGESMFAATVSEGLHWARSRHGFTVLDLRPRYLPPWSRLLLRIPLLRELLTWNLWLVLRRDQSEPALEHP